MLIDGAIAVGGGDFIVVSDFEYEFEVESVTIGCAIEIPENKKKNRVTNIRLYIFVIFLCLDNENNKNII